ncbi:MAG: ABC transporter permease subunit [Clostridia bacterium]|nr:ABC transporter permease subunit [Clostridia bacterium]
MKAMFNKEFRGYFNSPTGYIFVGVFLFFCAMFFVNMVIVNQSATLILMFNSMNLICLFLVAILTMKLWSEEMSRKTDQLLICSPVSPWGIVMGKYLAACAVLGVALVFSLIFPVILNIFSNPPLSELISSYLGFILLWCSFIAIGLYISSLTENQMISAILTFGVLFVVFLINYLTSTTHTALWIRKIVGAFALLDRYYDFQLGMVSIPDVTYYFSVIFLFLYLTKQNVVKRRYK